ncbi:hypothetical protein ACP4OV_002866 [Aristida adscensionis]
MMATLRNSACTEIATGLSNVTAVLQYLESYQEVMQVLKGHREFNLKQVLYKGKLLIPPVPNQCRASTCFIHSSCTCVEALYKRKCALANPQTDFEVVFSATHLIDQYTQKYGFIGQEDGKKTGVDRLLRALGLMKDFGAKGFKDEEMLGPFKIRSFKSIPPVYLPKAKKKMQPKPQAKMPYNIQDLLEHGHVMIATFKISTNYPTLKPGEIYKYDKKHPLRYGGRTCSRSVAIIGYGVRD